MDQIIETLSEILSVSDKEISDLLPFSVHRLDVTSSYGSMVFSLISAFEIISPPLQTAKLNALSAEQKDKIFDAVLLIYPIANDSPEVREIRYIADPSLRSEREFVQYINDENLINDISVALNLLERKPPKFWSDYKKFGSSVLEDDFRSEFFRMLGMKYQVGSEEESKVGRTDLILKSSSIRRKIFEFKVWRRNDFRGTSSQLLRYLTEIDDSGYVIMANSQATQSITDAEYEEVIKSCEYIEDSLQSNQTAHGLKYFEADYNFNGNKKKIYHFILNLK